jgi:SAM-dependent methyltransferase
VTASSEPEAEAPAPPSTQATRRQHWDAVYGRTTDANRSWFQAEPTTSLELVEELGVGPEEAVVDVGGGTSYLVDRLLARGFADVTVVDVSDVALATVRTRLGGDPRVTFVAGDVLDMEPPRPVGLWHDRAVLHFLSGDDVARYREALERSVRLGGAVIVATFAPDGPPSCSGLPVTGYDAAGLGVVLGSCFTPVTHCREVHRTPWGAPQPFTWLAARRTV